MLPLLVGQEGEAGINIINIIYLFSFLFFMFYGQKLQTWMILREIGTAVFKLKEMRDRARDLAISTVKAIGKEELDPTPRIDHLLEYFLYLPTNLDPSGIVPKFEHVFDVHDQRFKDEVNIIAPEADEIQSRNIEGVLSVAIGLNEIYRIVNHFYLLGKKTMSLYTIVQIQMQLPLIMQLAESYSSAVKAFAEGQPIGDGAGAIVAGKLMYGKASRKISNEIVVTETQLDGRRLLVLKAEGPGATVGGMGKIGAAIGRLIEEEKGKLARIIMVDAGQKYEGEKSGGVSEGIGPIIGGVGVDKFTIEGLSLKYKIPVYAVKVKESIRESVSPITKEILEGTEVAFARVKRIIREGVKEGETVIVAGIGNTIGIGQ